MDARPPSPRGPVRILLCIGSVLLLVPFIGAPATAHGGHGPVTYDELEIRFLMPAGESGEVEFEMSQGETVEWDVRTEDERPLYVELHSHGFEFRRHEVTNATSHANGTFEAPLTGYYGILVEHNRSGAVQAHAVETAGDEGEQGHLEEDVLVHLRIEGWFSLLGLVDIEPLEDAPVEGSPGPVVWWVALVWGMLGVAGRRRH